MAAQPILSLCLLLLSLSFVAYTHAQVSECAPEETPCRSKGSLRCCGTYETAYFGYESCVCCDTATEKACCGQDGNAIGGCKCAYRGSDCCGNLQNDICPPGTICCGESQITCCSNDTQVCVDSVCQQKPGGPCQNNTFSITSSGELECCTSLPCPGTDTLSLPLTSQTSIGFPSEALVFESESDINGAYQGGGETQIYLYVNAGNQVGQAIQARVRYDFEGDGEWDREEIFRFFALDPLESTVELYSFGEEATPEEKFQRTVGSYLTIASGKFQLQVWQVFPYNQPIEILTKSYIEVPYRFFDRELITSPTILNPCFLSVPPVTERSINQIPSEFTDFRDVLGGAFEAIAGSSTSFSVMVDGGNEQGKAIQLAIRYYRTGELLRTEIFPFFALDDIVGFETYSSSSEEAIVEGDLEDDPNVIEFIFWQPFPRNSEVLIDTASLRIVIPYDFGGRSLFLTIVTEDCFTSIPIESE